MSMDQYLMLMRKTREEYMSDLQPQAEERVKRQLVLDAITKQEEIKVEPEELESLLRAYEQIGQPLRSEGQLRALASSLLREKTVSRLVELTTDPEPVEEAGEEDVSSEVEQAENALPDTSESFIDSPVEEQAEA